MNDMTNSTHAGPSEEALRRANEQALRELDQEYGGRAGAQRRAGKSLLEKAHDAWRSSGVGIAQAGFQTSDFVRDLVGVGAPSDEEKSDLRRGVEHIGQELDEESPVNAITSDISQFITGLIGAGKIMAPVRGVQKLQAGRAAFEVGRGAAAGGIAMDPHEERLSNLIQSYPALENPVSEYLAADPDDSATEGRLKNALEGVGLDLAIIGALAASVRALRYFRNGNEPKARATLDEAEQAYAETFTLEESFDVGLPPAPKDPVAASPGAKASDRAATPGSPTNASSGLSGVKETANAPDIEITPESVREILKSTEADLDAISRFGSREAALEAGQVLTRSGRLPWQKLRATEEVETFVENAAAVLRAEMDTAKGGDIMSDPRVSEMIQTRAELFGEDPALAMGRLVEAGEAARSMVPDMEASFLIANRMYQETYDVAFKLRNGMLDEWGGSVTRATEELKARLTAATDLQAAAKSMSSNSGRALRRMRGQFRVKPEDLERIKGLDGSALADLIYSTKGDPKRLAQVANPSFLTRWTSRLGFSLTNSLLWLYPTHVVNLSSNLYMLAARPTEKLLGSVTVRGPQGPILRDAAIKEYSYTVASLSDGWSAMVEAFKRGDSLLSPRNTEYFGAGSSTTRQQRIEWIPVQGLWDVVRNGLLATEVAIGLPTRSLGAVDEFIKTLRYRAYVQAEAATRANSQGLSGDEFKSFIAREMERAIDPATGQANNRRALQEAQVTTFQQELLSGTAGATVQMARSRHPVLTFVLPFVKTPVNVLRYGWKMTPGLNVLQTEYREALLGRHGAEAQAQATGQMALGSLFMGISATMALNGKITGAGPSEPNLQKELRATGWQPYSYVLEDADGERRYVPMGRFDPAGMVFSMVANLVEISRLNPEGKDAEQGIAALSLALAKNFTDRTFLLNLNQALQALTEPGERGEKWLGTIAGNTIPFSSAIRGLNPDPYLRDARGFIDTMMKNLPGYSETLPPTRDVFGEPVWKRIGITTTNETDLVEAEHNRIMLETGRGLGRPDPHLGGEDLRGVTLANGRNAYDRLQELGGQLPSGPSLKQRLATIIQSDWYQELPDGEAEVKGTRLNALSRQVSAYRRAAKEAFMAENPELHEIAHKRQREAFVARQRNRQEQPGAHELLDALGYPRSER
ncbi:MAG: hypothetical protein JJ911_12695 [Rhizobiaceae bacterium]|nr:hypothetical protein [Rhizobiaceae bacterium]